MTGHEEGASVMDPTALAQQIAAAMALKWTSGTGYRNPNWDIDGPDDETNPYYLPVPMEERVQQAPFEHFAAADGGPSFAPVSIAEIAAFAAEVVVSTMHQQSEPS